MNAADGAATETGNLSPDKEMLHWWPAARERPK